MSDPGTLATQDAALLVAGVVIVAVLGVSLVVLARRLRRAEARLDALTRGEDGQDLAGVLDAHLEQVHAVARRQEQLALHSAELDVQAGRSIQGVGLVRFNTFEDTGGNQSFVLALLDPGGDGVILNSLHARNQTRLYAKAVRAGGVEGALSDEESQALRLASTRVGGR